MSTKRIELEDISDHFSLQLDNPVNVLTQDMARQFLNSSSAKDKYKFFVKGTQLEQLDHDYRLLSDTCESIEAQLNNRTEDLDVLKRKSREAEDKMRRADKQRSLQDKQKQVRRQYAWAQVVEEEQVRSNFQLAVCSTNRVIGP